MSYRVKQLRGGIVCVCDPFCVKTLKRHCLLVSVTSDTIKGVYSPFRKYKGGKFLYFNVLFEFSFYQFFSLSFF